MFKFNFHSKGIGLPIGLGLVFTVVCLLIQYSSFYFASLTTEKPNFVKLESEPYAWDLTVSSLAAGSHALGIGPVFGRCDLLDMKGAVLDTSKSFDQHTRNSLFLYTEFATSGARLDSFRLQCEQLSKFGVLHTLRRAAFAAPAPVKLTLLFHFLIDVMLGPIACLYLIFSVLLHGRTFNSATDGYAHHLFFSVVSFLYMLSLSHWPALFYNLPTFSFYQSELRILFSLTFVRLLGNYSKQSSFQLYAHLALMAGTVGIVFWGMPYFNIVFFYFLIAVTILTVLATRDLWKENRLINPFNQTMLYALAVCWSALQVFGLVGSYFNLSQIVSPSFVTAFSFIILVIRHRERLSIEAERSHMRDLLNVHEGMARLAKQVSHDIQSPLVALSSALKTGAMQGDAKKMVETSLIRIESIIKDLSSHKNIISGRKLESQDDLVCSLRESVVSVINEKIILINDTNIKITLANSIDDNIKVQINPGIFERVFANILNNAIEAVAAVHLPEIDVSFGSNGDKAVIHVTDNGPGLAPHVLESIGKIGNTYGKDQGSGLGLSHAIEQLAFCGGALKLENKHESGAHASIILRRVD